MIPNTKRLADAIRSVCHETGYCSLTVQTVQEQVESLSAFCRDHGLEAVTMHGLVQFKLIPPREAPRPEVRGVAEVLTRLREQLDRDLTMLGPDDRARVLDGLEAVVVDRLRTLNSPVPGVA